MKNLCAGMEPAQRFFSESKRTFNEVLASRIMDRLDIPHVKYSLLVEDDYPYSVCEDFITPETELISAWYLMQTSRKPNHISIYQHYINCCEENGVPEIRKALDQMIVLDYLLVNEDRHLNNFGVVRKAESLKYMCAAPIFDSGTSMWFDKPTAMIGDTPKLVCKPFKNTHEDQIKLVSSFEWLAMEKLSGIEEEFREIVRGSLFVDEKRCEGKYSIQWFWWIQERGDVVKHLLFCSLCKKNNHLCHFSFYK